MKKKPLEIISAAHEFPEASELLFINILASRRLLCAEQRNARLVVAVNVRVQSHSTFVM